jgi:hypothetical protein
MVTIRAFHCRTRASQIHGRTRIPPSMNTSTRCLTVLLVFLTLSGHAVAQALPKYRPALPGRGKSSLVELIDTQRLMAQGQDTAILMFETGVSKSGRSYDSRTYRESPGAEKLRREVLSKLDIALFEPAVFNHVYVNAYIQGTVNFFIKDGKPHLRVFLHQEDEALLSGHDFVAPQFAFVPGNPQFRGLYNPHLASGQQGIAVLKVDVDLEGRVQGTKVIHEHPPGQGYGARVATDLREARFVPGFRNGKPVACQFTWTMIFTGPKRQIKTG